MFSRAERSRLVIGAAALAAGAAISLGGCGDDDPDTTTAARPEQLTRAELALMEETELAVEGYCIRAANRVRESGAAPPVAEYERVVHVLDRLAGLAQEKPEASGPAGETPRFALGDIAESLEGSNCDSRLVRRIDEELATIPVE